jgi:hypothetical protein
MTVSIGGITLPDDLIWENEHSFTGVDSRVEKSTGGAPIIWEGEIGGRPADLVGGDNWGWITLSQRKDMKALASVPRSTYELIHGTESYTVRFRNEEGEPIEAEPVKPMPGYEMEDDDMYCNVRIKLMIV